MIEVWKDIDNYKGHYQVSNLNKVRSLDRLCVNRYRKGAILKLDLYSDYARVTLTKNNIPKRFSVHRLMMIAFVPNPLNKPCINHIDGIPLNNGLSNLEWCTYSENAIHAYKTKLQIPKRGADSVKSKVVCMIDINTNEVLNTYKSTVIAQDATGVYRTGIRNCCTGRVKTAGGYKWKYKENKFSIDREIDKHKTYL
jgi:hypothetical protein